MEKEQALMERELLMEAHLKDARLKYLQSQVDPHFLFNTLNAGSQLAFLEGAKRTQDYVQKVADFFRYTISLKKEDVSLEEEIRMVDTYIYILNVRFSPYFTVEPHPGDANQFDKHINIMYRR